MQIKNIIAGIMAISLASNMSLIAFAEAEDTIETITETEVVQEVAESEGEITEQVEETENVTEETKADVEGTVAEESTDVSETEAVQGDSVLTLFVSCVGTLTGSVIETDNVKVYVNGDYLGGLSSEQCADNWSKKLDSWQVGDTAHVEIAGLSEYVGSVTVQGNQYAVINGYVEFDITAEEIEETYINPDFDWDAYESGNLTEEELQNATITETKIADVDVTCNTVTSCMFLQVFNKDGSVASGAKVKGFFRVYDTDYTDETVDYVDLETKNYTANSQGMICIQATPYAQYQSFVYEVSLGQNYKMDEITAFYITDNDNIYRRIFIPEYKQIIPDGAELLDETLKEQQDAIEQVAISSIKAITSFRNVDDTFVNPTDLTISFLNKDTGVEYIYPLTQFGESEIGDLPQGKYNVQYIGDSYFGIEGVQEVVIDEETYELPVAVTANYQLDLHRVKNGREVQWTIIHPLTGEVIRHTGVMSFAILPGMHFYMSDEDGNSFDVALGVDMDGVFFDMETGFAEFFDSDGLSDSNINEIPQTGDIATTVLGITLGIAGAGGITYAVARKKKKVIKSEEVEEEFDIL